MRQRAAPTSSSQEIVPPCVISHVLRAATASCTACVPFPRPHQSCDGGRARRTRDLPRAREQETACRGSDAGAGSEQADRGSPTAPTRPFPDPRSGPQHRPEKPPRQEAPQPVGPARGLRVGRVAGQRQTDRGLRPMGLRARGPGRFFEGGLNFHPDTGEAYRGPGMPPHAGRASKGEQIRVAERVLSDQGWDARPRCSRKLEIR